MNNFTVDNISYSGTLGTPNVATVMGTDLTGAIVIPNTVTFNGNTYNVTTIGAESFSSRSNISSFTIPENITTIGVVAFASMTNLASITFLGNAPQFNAFSSFYPFHSTTTILYYYTNKTGWPVDNVTTGKILGGNVSQMPLGGGEGGGGGNNSVDCFAENTEILCKVGSQELYVPIQELHKNILIKTSKDGFIPLEHIAKATIYNPHHMHRHKNRLYKYSKEQFEDLTQDLYLTGCHSILVDELHNSQRNAVTKILGDVYVTDEKYRLPSCLYNKAEPHSIAGKYDIYHITLQSDDAEKNYGIYANGLLVESCCKKNLVESSMEIIE
jgi:hypothetical protein